MIQFPKRYVLLLVIVAPLSMYGSYGFYNTPNVEAAVPPPPLVHREKVKVFREVDGKPVIEDQINTWLKENPTVQIVDRQVQVASAGGVTRTYSGGATSCRNSPIWNNCAVNDYTQESKFVSTVIVVTIFYRE